MITEYFSEEVATIKTDEIRGFVEFCLQNAPPYFGVVPSSSSGKYHPPQSNGKGGLLRHTKAVACVAESLIRAYDLKGAEADTVRAACLLHDIVKYGVGDMKPHTTKNHDYEGALFVYQLGQKYVAENIGAISPDQVRGICSGVAWHMGRWHTNKQAKTFPTDFSHVEQIVHLADMVAANKNIGLVSLMEPSVGIG